MDHQAGGNGAKLSKLQIEELHQYSSKELFGANASTVDGQFWSVEDLIHVVREQYGVEYKDAARYGIDWLKEIVPVWKKRDQTSGTGMGGRKLYSKCRRINILWQNSTSISNCPLYRVMLELCIDWFYNLRNLLER